MVCHAVRGLAFDAAELQRPSPASPPGCLSGPLLGENVPRDTVHRRYAATTHGLAPRPPVERAGVQRVGLRCHPRMTQGASRCEPGTLPVNRAERSLRSSSLPLAASGQVRACRHRMRCEQAPGLSRGVSDEHLFSPASAAPPGGLDVFGRLPCQDQCGVGVRVDRLPPLMAQGRATSQSISLRHVTVVPLNK
jgi:hypothetical protein